MKTSAPASGVLQRAGEPGLVGDLGQLPLDVREVVAVARRRRPCGRRPRRRRCPPPAGTWRWRRRPRRRRRSPRADRRAPARSAFAALRRAASVTTAVPCWSSWKTGMSRRSWSLRSISKQRGAEMSSRLTPPKDGASRTTVSTISSTSVQASAIGTASTPPNCLNRIALPSITGREASGPMSPRPEHGRAVRHDGDDLTTSRCSRGRVPAARRWRCTPSRRRACTRGTGRPCRGPARWPARPSCRRGAARTPDRRHRGARPPAVAVRSAVAARIDDLRCHFVLPLKSSWFEGGHSWLRRWAGTAQARHDVMRTGAVRDGRAAHAP